MSKTISPKDLAYFRTLYPVGTGEYRYLHFKTVQEFALSGGLNFQQV